MKEIKKINLGTKIPKLPTWEQYCGDIGSSKQVVNRWLGRWFGKEELIKEKKIIALAEGKFEIIVIDPPWPYGTEYDAETRRVASPYTEMDLEDIRNIEIPASDDAVLWLWTTHKFLPDSFGILENWGFEYKLTSVWDKESLGMGSWLRCQAEFCLLGIKGQPEWNLTNERDVISEVRREHSRKPDGFYAMVDKLCYGRKLDMFSREKRKNWEQMGDQISVFKED